MKKLQIFKINVAQDVLDVFREDYNNIRKNKHGHKTFKE